jgi:hypothetical protein
MRTGLILIWLGEMHLADVDGHEEVMAFAFENGRVGKNMRRMRNQKEWWEQYCVGVTRITFSDAIKLQRPVDENRQDIQVLVSSGTTNEPYVATIVGSWPLQLIWMHVGSEHGARFPALKPIKMNSYNTHYLWLLLAMMISIPSFWLKVASLVWPDDEWPGWMLSYTTQHCLPSRKQRSSRNDPFSKHKTIAEMVAVTVGYFVNDLFTAEELFNEVVSVVGGIDRVHASLLLDEVSVVPDGVDIIVAFWYESDGRMELSILMYSRAGNPTFELQFVGMLDTPDTRGNMNRWSGTCYYRHGGHMFPGWWKQCRNDCGASKKNKKILFRDARERNSRRQHNNTPT